MNTRHVYGSIGVIQPGDVLIDSMTVSHQNFVSLVMEVSEANCSRLNRNKAEHGCMDGDCVTQGRREWDTDR